MLKPLTHRRRTPNLRITSAASADGQTAVGFVSQSVEWWMFTLAGHNNRCLFPIEEVEGAGAVLPDQPQRPEWVIKKIQGRRKTERAVFGLRRTEEYAGNVAQPVAVSPESSQFEQRGLDSRRGDRSVCEQPPAHGLDQRPRPAIRGDPLGRGGRELDTEQVLRQREAEA